MINAKKAMGLAILLLSGAVGCADLEVVNPNDADRERTLGNASDVEALIAGAWSRHYDSRSDNSGPQEFLSLQAFSHSASWNNFCMVPCSGLPRQALQNDPAWSYYGNLSHVWDENYGALAAVAEGFRTLDANPAMGEELGADALARIRAFGRFVQGIGLGAIAVFYDKGWVVDETLPVDGNGLPEVPAEPADYHALATAALGYLDQAIAMAEGASFTIPVQWSNKEMTAQELAKRASTFKARIRAAVARTPEERQAVDWATVIAELESGIDSWSYTMNFSNWENSYIANATYDGWGWLDYMVVGMADQAGDVQAWWNTPINDRLPDMNGEPVLIVTPDLRFPQGTTFEEQLQNPGTLVEIMTTDPELYPSVSSVRQKPDRGTWRWSWYRATEYDDVVFSEGGDIPAVNADEIRLLKAEAYYWMGDRAMAAELINVTRTAAGLNATDASGTNTSCVPKLPNGACGDLLEMLKWEKRLETRLAGLYGASWYIDSRAWGDLYRGTQISLPVPCQEFQILQAECYDVGGDSGILSAPTSTYAWPFEG